jgi:pilus assembly protein Flp/PilA
MFETLRNRIASFVQDEEGASMIEYILLLALVAVALIAGFRIVGEGANTKLAKVGEEMTK